MVTNGEWYYRDACVSWDPFSLKLQLAQAAPQTSRSMASASGPRASLLWPLQSPPQFIEFVGNVWKEPRPYLLKNGIRGEEVRNYPLAWHTERVGFAYSISLDNLWHALWHAVPMREFAERAAAYVESTSATTGGMESAERADEAAEEVAPLVNRSHASGIVTTASRRLSATAIPSSSSSSTTTTTSSSPSRLNRFDILPDYTYLWPKLPKGARHNRTGRFYGPTAEGFRAYVSTPGRVAGWPGWELSGLSLMRPMDWARAVNRSQSVLSVVSHVETGCGAIYT